MKHAVAASVLALALALFAAPQAHASDFSPAQLKAMGVFVSNFTELGLLNFDRDHLLKQRNSPDLVRFGIWHNYINNRKSRVAACGVAGCRWGSLVIREEYVRESVRKFFDSGLDIPETLSLSDPPCHFEKGLCHFEGADGEYVRLARVKEARKNPDGTVTMRGVLFNAEDERETDGSFVAMARPFSWKGKQTWSILSLYQVDGDGTDPGRADAARQEGEPRQDAAAPAAPGKRRFATIRLESEFSQKAMMTFTINEFDIVTPKDRDLIKKYHLPADLDGNDYEICDDADEWSSAVAFKDSCVFESIDVEHGDLIPRRTTWQAFVKKLRGNPDGLAVTFELDADNGLARVSEYYIP